MASDGTPAVPSTSGTSPSLTDLKGIVKDSLRELLRDEPSLFARKTGRGSPGSSGGDAPGGKYHNRSLGDVLVPVDGHVAGVRLC